MESMQHGLTSAGRQFHIGALNVRDKSGVSSVQFAVWSDVSGGSDLAWYNASNYGSGNWGALVDIKNHGKHGGNYQIHAYATDGAGNKDLIGYAVYNVTADLQSPTLSEVKYDVDATGTIVTLVAYGVTDPSGVAGVRVAVWAEDGDGSDLRWYSFQPAGNGTWIVQFALADYDFVSGYYTGHVYATDGFGNDGLAEAGRFLVPYPEITYGDAEYTKYYPYFIALYVYDITCNYGVASVIFDVYDVTGDFLASYEGTNMGSIWSCYIDYEDIGDMRRLCYVDVYIKDYRGVYTYMDTSFVYV